MNITASELNKHTGRAINQSLQSPLIIEKAGHPTVVMMSYELYKEMENLMWLTAAERAESNEPLASRAEVDEFMNS